MLGIGIGEIMIIAVVALLFVGPERLPKVMRELGRQYGRLRRAADELRRAFVLEADRQDAAVRYAALQERRQAAAEIRRKAQEDAGEGTVAQDNPMPGLAVAAADEGSETDDAPPSPETSSETSDAPPSPVNVSPEHEPAVREEG
jgi:sec-independent protein translocase protein TatB